MKQKISEVWDSVFNLGIRTLTLARAMGKTDYLGRSFDGIFAGNYFTILIIANYNSIKWWTPPPSY